MDFSPIVVGHIIKANNNEIKFRDNIVGNFYNFQKLNNQTDIRGSLRSHTSKNSEHSELVINIFSFLVSLFSFENYLQNKLNVHKFQNNNPINSSSIKSSSLEEKEKTSVG